MTETTQPDPAAEWRARQTDIPAGQGAASLFLKPDARGYVDLYEKGADGGVARILDLDEHSAALADHLAATLPTIDTEEEST